MTLGQRIREARLERQMTQQELVGDYITRNMLSKIENDVAAPSVRTLEYLAAAMGLPPGAFLSDLSADYSAEQQLLGLQELLEKDAPEFSERLEEALSQWERNGIALRLLKARALLKEGQSDEAAALLQSLPVPKGHPCRFAYCLLQGQIHSARGEHAEALPLLQEAEALLEGQTPADRNTLWTALEESHSQTNDFRLAYHYARIRRDQPE